MKIFLKRLALIITEIFVLSGFFILIITFSNISVIHTPAFEDWLTFVDDLETGSYIDPSKYFITLEGNIEVTMIKAADPEWIEKDPPSKYPYVGIGTYFESSGNPVDLSEVEHIRLVYKLDGPVSLVLSQYGIKTGNEFIFDLPYAEEYTELTINWSDFYQPFWANRNSGLDIRKITRISFQIRTVHGSTAKLGIHSINFLKNTIK